MLDSNRFTLEKYNGMKTRYFCPACNDRVKTFVRYIDINTNKHLADHVGKCNRSDKCGYHYKPKEYFKSNNISFNEYQTNFKPIQPIKRKSTSFIEVQIFKASLKEYESNNFIKFLLNQFGEGVTNELISRYFIGTSKKWNGSTVFWQIDIEGRIRTGKIMQYNPTTGKRIKVPYSLVTWVHTELKLKDFELNQCFFGEHLLNDKTKPVAIVESEKTAIICSVHFPQLIWLASGSKEGLNESKCKILEGRNVILFPDLNCYEYWKNKKNKAYLSATMQVSNILESISKNSTLVRGEDLIDFINFLELN